MIFTAALCLNWIKVLPDPLIAYRSFKPLLGNKERVIAFCRGIQRYSPVDSHVTPEAWDMPGYNDQVIMAAGAFVQGSSIELSADAP